MSQRNAIALVNPETYASFVSENWQLEELVHHFLSEINYRHMIAWGCVHGNWRLEFHDNLSDVSGYQEIYGTIHSKGTLLLANYDDLTEVAQFFDKRLPLTGMEDFQLSIPPGSYLCRVVQLFDPGEAEPEEVFYQESPHFIIELKEDEKPVEPWSKIPWF